MELDSQQSFPRRTRETTDEHTGHSRGPQRPLQHTRGAAAPGLITAEEFQKRVSVKRSYAGISGQFHASRAVWLTTEVLERCAIVCYATLEVERFLIAKRSIPPCREKKTRLVGAHTSPVTTGLWRCMVANSAGPRRQIGAEARHRPLRLGSGISGA